MKLVHHPNNAPHTGHLKCSECSTLTPAWKSSGMSESRPHFYCNLCSNALVRACDKEHFIEFGATQETIDLIEPTLPSCSCGGKFTLGANPKCPQCDFEFKHQKGIIGRLSDSHVILLDGAVLNRDDNFDYQVSIGSRLKYRLRSVQFFFKKTF